MTEFVGDKKYHDYIARARRGEVRICGTSPYKLMKQHQNDRNTVENAVKEELDDNQPESDDVSIENQSRENDRMNQILDENRRLKKQILRLCRRTTAPKHGTANATTTATAKTIFTCAECGKVFTYKSSMNRHVNGVHLKQNTQKCTLCPYSTHQSTNLRTHMALRHGVPVKRQAGVKRQPAHSQLAE